MACLTSGGGAGSVGRSGGVAGLMGRPSEMGVSKLGLAKALKPGLSVCVLCVSLIANNRSSGPCRVEVFQLFARVQCLIPTPQVSQDGAELVLHFERLVNQGAFLPAHHGSVICTLFFLAETLPFECLSQPLLVKHGSLESDQLGVALLRVGEAFLLECGS